MAFTKIAAAGIGSTGTVTLENLLVTGSITASLTGTATTTTNIPNLTGAITSSNTTTSLGSFTSSQLATALTDETGSGAAVFATSPTLSTVTVSSGGINVTGVSTSLTSINTPFYTNPTIITSSYTVPINQNSFTAGPIGIDTGITISVSSGSYLKVI